MASINKVILIGRLGANPELKHTPGGSEVSNFSIATSEHWKDKDGNSQEKTEWHKIVCWGKTAKLASEYLSKGKLIYIEGKLQTRKWEKDGQDHYTTEVLAQSLQFLSPKEEGEAKPKPASTMEPVDPKHYEDLVDDIPF